MPCQNLWILSHLPELFELPAGCCGEDLKAEFTQVGSKGEKDF